MLFIGAVLFSGSGCATRNGVAASGSVLKLSNSRYLVVGVALIEIEPATQPEAAQVVRGRVLGLHLSDQPGLKIGLGYSDAQVVRVPAEAADDVRLEVHAGPGGRVKVDIQSAKLKAEFRP